MNILDYKRKSLGYTFRGEDDYQQWYIDQQNARTAPAPAPAPAPVLSPLEAATANYTDAAAALGKATGEDMGPAQSSYDVARRAFLAAGGVEPKSSNNLGFLGNLFAGIDSSLGLSQGVTAISGGLADLDASLGLSKNAPVIVGAAAAYFLPGIGQALGQSLVNAGVLTGAAATPAMATTIGTALAQTGVSVAQGKSLDQALGDAILSAGMGELTKVYGAGVKSAIGQITTNPIAQNAIFKAGTDVVTAVAQGKTGDQIVQGIGNSIVSSVAGAAANEVVRSIPGIDSLSPAQQNIVKSGIATSIQGGDGTKSMLNTALREGTNYVLDAVTSTPIAPGTAGTTGAMQGGFGDGIASGTAGTTGAMQGGFGSGVTADTVAGGATLDDIESTLAANGLQNRSEPDDFDFSAFQLPPGWQSIGQSPTPSPTPSPAPSPTPSTGTPSVSNIFGGSRGFNPNYYAGQYGTTQPSANTGYDAHMASIQGGYNPFEDQGFGDGGDGPMDNPWGESGAVTSTTTGKPGETSMAQNASQTGGTNTANADEWGDLQGAMDAATARGINAKAPTFGEAFSSWRTALGANKEFPWTNPQTGETRMYSTALAPTESEKAAQAISDQKRIDLMPVYGGAQNTRTGTPLGVDNVYINTKTGDVVVDSRVFDAAGNLVSGSLNLADEGTTTAAINTAVGSTIRTGLDILAGIPRGMGALAENAGTLAGLTGLADMNNIATRTGASAKAAVDAMRSTDFKDDAKLINDAIAKAGNEGFFAQLIETGKQFGASPTQMAAFIVEQSPTLLVGGGGMAAAKALGAGMTTAQAAALGLNAATQGASVAKEAYDDAIKAGKSEDEALNASRLAGSLAAFTSVVANKFIPGALSTEGMIAAQTAAKTSIRNALIGEMSSEVAEEASGKVIANIIANRDWDSNLGTTVAQALMGSGLTTGIVHGVYNSLDAAGVPASERDAEANKILNDEVVTTTEAREIARELGYTNPSQQVLDSITGPKSEADARTELDTFLQSMSSFEAGKPVNAAAAQEMMADLGLSNMSDADAISLADQIVQSVPDDKLAPPVDDFLNKPGVTNEGATDVKNADDFLDKTGVTTEAPPVITSAEVSKIVTDALAANPSLTPDQVTKIVDDAVKTIPLGTTAADVQKIVDTAVKTIPTGPSAQDVNKIVTDALAANPSLTEAQVTKVVNEAIAKVPAGVSTTDVSNAINTAIANIPAGLSTEDVSKVVTDATKDLATKEGVGTAITGATKDLATTKSVDDLKVDLTKAIDDAGKNNADAFDAIDQTIADLKAAGLTEQQVQEVVDLSVGGATKTLQDAIDAAVTGNTNALDALQTKVATDIGASETKVTTAIADAETRLGEAIQAAKDLGLKGDEALQAGLDSVAADLGKSKEEVLTQLGKTEESLKTQFATDVGVVAKSVEDLSKTLTDSIAANEKAGLTRDEATQKAVDALATELGTTKTDLLAQLGTTEEALGKKVEAVAEDLGGKLTAQGKEFMDALVQQGMDQQTALETAMAAQTKLVTEGQAATQTALGELSAAQQQEVADRIAAGETTAAAIAAVQTAVETGQAALESKLTAQGKEFMDALVAQGMDQKTALDTAMTAQSKSLTELSTGFTTQLEEAEKRRADAASAWEAQRKLDLTEAEKQRGIDRQAELDRAAAAEKARQTEITNQKAREAANLRTIQTGQLRGQMQTGLQGLIGGLQQQATQMAAPGVVETVKATPGFSFDSPLNVGFFGGYESQKSPTKDKESLKIATGGYLDDLLEAIR